MALADKYCNLDLATGLDDGSSPANAWQTLSSLTNVTTGYAAGDRVNMSGTETLGATVTFTNSGTDNAAVEFRGVCTLNLDTTNNLLLTGHGLRFIGTIFNATGSAATEAMGLDSFQLYFCGCEFNVLGSPSGDGPFQCNTQGSAFENCLFNSVGSTATSYCMLITRVAYIDGCTVRVVSGGGGLRYLGNSSTRMFAIRRTTFDGNGTSGKLLFCAPLNSSGHALIEYCSFFDSTGIALDMEGPNLGDASSVQISNNVIWTVGTGIDLNNRAGGVLTFNNAIGNATSARYANAETDLIYDDIVLDNGDGNPFTDPGANDWTPNGGTVNGGLIKSVALPNTFQEASQKSFGDAGAWRHEDPAGGGGGVTRRLAKLYGAG